MVFLGYYSDTDIVKLVGWLFVFILGTTLLGYGGTGVEYQTGQNVSKTETFNDTYSASEYTVINDYETYNNKTLAFYILVLGMLGFSSVFYQFRNTRQQQGEND